MSFTPPPLQIAGGMSQSPLHRGRNSDVGAERRATYVPRESQSPLHRGRNSDGEIELDDADLMRMSQSPLHRGTHLNPKFQI